VRRSREVGREDGQEAGRNAGKRERVFGVEDALQGVRHLAIRT
jgi:hypothetical protein